MLVQKCFPTRTRHNRLPFILIVFFLFPVAFHTLSNAVAYSQKVQLEIESLSSDTSAFHTILAEANGGSGYQQDSTEDGDVDGEIAIADTFPDPAVAAAIDPNASAQGRSRQQSEARIVGNGALTSISYYSVQDTYNEVQGAFGKVTVHTFAANASGSFAVVAPGPEHEGESVWIETKIIITGLADIGDPDVEQGISGGLIVGDTDLRYDNFDGPLHVFGTLSDLSGTYPYDDHGIVGRPVLYARQYVTPGEEIQTASFHMGNSMLIADGEPGAMGIVQDVVDSAFFRAFVGIPGVPGDYNSNGVVDAADYTVWRDHLGEAYFLLNEGVGITEGMVTDEDYDFWKLRFGDAAVMMGNANATPEPCSVTLAVLAATSMGMVRSRRLHPSRMRN